MTLDGQNPDDLPQTFGYNADGTVAYIQVVTPAIPGSYSGGTYRKNLTYTSGVVTGVSAWVKQ